MKTSIGFVISDNLLEDPEVPRSESWQISSEYPVLLCKECLCSELWDDENLKVADSSYSVRQGARRRWYYRRKLGTYPSFCSANDQKHSWNETKFTHSIWSVFQCFAELFATCCKGYTME